MFEKIVSELHQEIDTNLRPALKKCSDLKGQVKDRELRNKLENKYAELSQAIDRAALCISLLKFEVSMEISDDFKVVRFPL